MLHLLIILVVIGFCLWLVNHYIPMDPKIKNILNIVVVIGVVLYVLNYFGILNDKF
jgi:hypothetical protein